MDNEQYDYRKYDQIWQRVAPQENPYPAVRAAAPAPSAGAAPAYQTLLREELPELHKFASDTLSALAKEFQLKILVSEPLDELFDLPGLYRTAREARELMTDERFHGEPVCSVAQLRTPLLLKNLEGRGDLVSPELRRLAVHDREKGTQYCETLYHYLTCCHSLKKTSDALYTHRNTVLYRIRRLQEDFAIPLEEPSQHADLLLGVSLILFEIKVPDFFLRAPKNEA